MQGLKIYTRSGEALTTEEIEFAHRVANTHKDLSFGVITMTDPTSGVIAEYHAYNNTVFTSGDVGAYFGYGSSVDMRCWCRGVVLAETASAKRPTRTIFTVEPPNAVPRYNVTTYKDSEGNVIRTVYGSVQIVGSRLVYENWPHTIYRNGDFQGTPDQLLTSNDTGNIWAEFNGSHDPVSDGYPVNLTGSWTPVSPSYEELYAAAQAEARQRSAVFLTDGMELGSVARYDIFDGTYTTLYGVMGSYLSDPFPWRGDSAAAVFNVIGQTASYTRVSDLTFTIPDEACYQKVSAPTYPDANVDQSIKDQWLIDWNAAQLVALNREHARRKKCSDGQLTYLRNGFLSPEFEYFIKTQHPVSALVRRDIPMEIVSRDQQLVSDTTDVDGNRTQLWSASITLKYDVADDQGNVTPVQKTFTGTVQKVSIDHANSDETISASTFLYTYNNFPLLAGNNTGKAYPLPSPLPDLPEQEDNLIFKTVNPIFHDELSLQSGIPLLVEANGTFLQSSWHSDSTYGLPEYSPDFIELIPPFEKSTDNLTFTHPQFLLDYIAASKPIEKEVIDGNKVPVTPSTDWLSSRLAHNEVVTIVPLSFVNADGEDRGMYPYSRTDEVPTQVKLVGFAKVKYNYYTGSFTFVSWTEFTTEGNIKHDGNASYDAETNPTSVNIGGTVYTLQPKYFAYDEEYGSTNCVCIAGKTPWTDTKAAYKTQKTNIADIPPEGYTLTDEELLYNEVRKSIK